MTTIAPSTQSLAHRFFSAISTGDWPSLVDILTPDATWTFPGDNTLTGTVTGIEQIAAKARLIASYGVVIGFEYVMFGTDSFIIKLHNTGRRGDLVLDEHLGTVCTVRAGRIATADTHLSDIKAMNLFFVPLAD
jgi:ketosteroid isomerase-like protein